MSFPPENCSFFQKECSKIGKSAILEENQPLSRFQRQLPWQGSQVRVAAFSCLPYQGRWHRVSDDGEVLLCIMGVRNMKAFITVIGHDTVGVVAKVAALCCELNINIEDVTQSVLQGMFAMIMLVDISKCSVSHEELHTRTDALAKEMGMQINLTRQEVFDAMHTI
jgi:ACT domain-containing protein